MLCLACRSASVNSPMGWRVVHRAILLVGVLNSSPLGTEASSKIVGTHLFLGDAGRSAMSCHGESEDLTVQKELQKGQWQASWDTEIAWWRKWFQTKGLSWPEDYRQRLDPNTELEHGVKRALLDLTPGATVKLLDVGSGPATSLGKQWKGQNLEITAVDPLATEYQQLYAEANVRPPVVPHALDGEKLTQALPRDYYDIVHSKNAVDHSYDAPEVIREMVRVTRPGGVVVVLVNENVAERERNWGLHQWNFEAVPLPYKFAQDQVAQPVSQRPQHVFLWNDGRADAAAFDVVLWNEHGRQRLEELFASCAYTALVEVREGYVEYNARYLTIHIRRLDQPCS